ncbi:MAG TPA: recombinase A [Polyangiaceae bacterium]|nr:recombinase A [Polyangiaceae bacterium]
MALPAHILDRLPPAIVRGSSLLSKREAPSGLPLGVDALDTALPDAGLLRGGVVELAVSGAAALGTSIALLACRAAQRESLNRGGEVPWCAFIDPSKTLYAPAVYEAGVDLERLLVVRPPADALTRVALRLVQAQAFAVTIIDTVGTPGCQLNVSLGTWPRTLRRISMALEGSPNTLLFITDKHAPRPLPLPVAMRVELERIAENKLQLHVPKDNRGRISRPRSIAWVRSPAPGTVAGVDSETTRVEHDLARTA